MIQVKSNPIIRYLSMILITLFVGVSLYATTRAIHNANNAVYVPYVVVIDEKGVATSAGFATDRVTITDKTIQETLTQLIFKIRSIPADFHLLNENVKWVYAHLKGKASDHVVNYFMHNKNDEDVFTRSFKENMKCKILSFTKIKNLKNTYSIEWLEYVYTPTGERDSPIIRMKAMIVIDFVKPSLLGGSNIKYNPYGIYVTDISWAKKN